MKNIKFKLCKAFLERFKATKESWFLGGGMKEVKTIRKDDISKLCAVFRVNFWQMYCAIHENYVVKFN